MTECPLRHHRAVRAAKEDHFIIAAIFAHAFLVSNVLNRQRTGDRSLQLSTLNLAK